MTACGYRSMEGALALIANECDYHSQQIYEWSDKCRSHVQREETRDASDASAASDRHQFAASVLSRLLEKLERGVIA